MSSANDIFINPGTYVTGVPHEEFARLREQSAVVWMTEPALPPWPAGPGFWGVVRHAEIKQVMRDPATFSSYARATQIMDPPTERDLAFVRQMMLNQDPPGHSRLRRMLASAFTPKAVARLEDRITTRARELVDRVASDHECDFAELAADLPLRTLAEIFGVPQQDRWLLYDWSNRVIGYQDPEYALSAKASAAGSTEMARHAMALRPEPDENGVLPNQRTRDGMPDLYAYAGDLAELKRREPGEDVMSNLVAEGVTTAEFENMFWLFAVAGNETLRNGLPGGLHALMSDMDQYRRVMVDRSLLPGAVEEMLRWWSPVMRFRRTAVVDTVLGGQEIRAGDKVVVWFSSGNRDERVFAEPDRFDVTRSSNDHLSFGHGPHYCIGAHLAKAQMRALFSAVFDRLGEVRPAGEMVRLRSNFQHGVKRLPISW
ncbi:cytochrome P450 [Actinophytocola oryzae]|uniref:Cytochrome P450 n=1 Tax=Actinophytocola oryzae TaxID=502181 RepID=A0A4R7V096_9PSEU|nr:cytochrome P450 [Actinophytocola oryzae]TDV42678.1 cytochrome P450 [Actinophytocola oryzae]